jgi:hypothetical protein
MHVLQLVASGLVISLSSRRVSPPVRDHTNGENERNGMCLYQPTSDVLLRIRREYFRSSTLECTSPLVGVEMGAEEKADRFAFFHLGETMFCFVIVMRDSMRFSEVREESDPCRHNCAPALLTATESRIFARRPTLHAVSFCISSFLLLHTTLMRPAVFNATAVLRATHITGAGVRSQQI